MKPPPERERLDWRRPLLAGLGLAGLLASLVSVRSWSLFLTSDERWRYVFAVVGAGVAASVVLWSLSWGLGRLAARGRDPERAFGRVLGMVVGAVAAAIGWSLTEGRRVRDAPWREAAVLAGAVVVALVAQGLARWLRATPPRRSLAALAVTLAVVAFVADATVLPRLYPALHWALALFGVTAANIAAWRLPLRPTRRPRLWAAPALLLAASAAWALPRLAAHPNARFVALEGAPLVGKLLPRLAPPPPEPPPPSIELGLVEAAEGLELGDADVLLITIDALRADRLAAYGGHGLTPELDALARESRVFLRAYTPTPHTSYALTSLLTGKYLRPVLELPGATSEHPALPELLRRFGYRTAAFYPPAIFFVDAHRFRELAAAGFGFEYRKVMFAPAAARVPQLDRYLGEVDEGHPVFAWVHLFEPHEPYDPPAEFRRGEGRVERYDGEVAAADAAVGELVRVFRRHRPGGTVIVTADHGEELGDHGGWYHGTTLYDEQVRVPLIWSSPGVVPAGTTDAPVELVDLATTLLAALGVPRDARMRGDDLGALLREAGGVRPEYAFAEVERERMACDGRFKAICGELGCRLYDLARDPGEVRNLAAAEPARLRRLQGAIAAFVASIPQAEAMQVGRGAWPEALARAGLGDASAAPELLPLLGDERAEVRAAAARALGELGYGAARPTLARLRTADPDAQVRAEAAIAGLLLGDEEARGPVAALLGESGERRERAALALGDAGDRRAVDVLRALVEDTAAEESRRTAAVAALGRLRAGEDALLGALAEVRLRPHVVAALARFGSRRAADAIAQAMATERYLPARAAEARALFALGDRRALGLTRRFLGVDTPFPGAVALLLEHGELDRPSEWGARLSDPAVRRGQWRCQGDACVPLSDAAVRLPGRWREPRRAVFLVAGDGTLVVDGVRHSVRDGGQVALTAEQPRWSIGGDAGVVAVATAPLQSEIPPPAPEPWEPEDEAPEAIQPLR